MSEGSNEGDIVHLSDVRERKLRESDQTPLAPVVANPPVGELSRNIQTPPNALKRALLTAAGIATAASAVFGYHKYQSNPIESSQAAAGAMVPNSTERQFQFRDRPETDFQRKATQELSVIDQNDPRVKKGLEVGENGANFRNVPMASADAETNAGSVIGKLKPGTVIEMAMEVPGKSLDGSKWYAANLGGKVGFFSASTLKAPGSVSK